MDLAARENARPGRYFMNQARQPANPLDGPPITTEPNDGYGQHELTTAQGHKTELLHRLWEISVKRLNLNPLLEYRRDYTRFLVHCTAVEWASIQQEAWTR